MDDFKREMYMKAKQTLENDEEYFVCNALLEVLSEYSVYPECAENQIEYEEDSYFNEIYAYQKESILREFFPEFTRLNDKRVWDPDGTYREQQGIRDVWWSPFERWKGKDPRILILDTILRD